MQSYHFVIILSTIITAQYELNQVKLAIANCTPVIEWNQDLDDEDKVLRIVSTEDVSDKLVAELQKSGIVSKIMGVFVKKYASN